MVETVFKNKEEFLRRKKGIRSEADVTAQQLINIYRQLSVLGEGATQRYNQQLISQVNPEVLSSLRTIPGGEEVKDYYDFLMHAEIEDKESALDTEGDVINTLLPQPEELSPLWATYGMPVVNGAPLKTVIQTAGKPLAVSLSQSANVAPTQNEMHSQADFNKIRHLLLEQFDKQKQMLKHAFETIVIDSNIEKMHTNLKTAAEEMMQQLDTEKEKSLDALSDLDTFSGFQDIHDNGRNQEKKKATSNYSYKNFHKKTERKFSVDMTEEE